MTCIIGGKCKDGVVIIADKKIIDPETSLTGSSQNLSGYDYFNNPGTKSYLFNLKVGL